MVEASSFYQKRGQSWTSSWDEPILDEQAQEHIREIAALLKMHYPAHGRWDVGGTTATLWVDASALALDVVLEVNGAIIEDAAWLRSDDGQHINMAELDTVIEGLNLGLSWQMKDVELMTESLTVHRWLNDSLPRAGAGNLFAAAGRLVVYKVIRGPYRILKQKHSLLYLHVVLSTERR
ncbi:hypothetical protein M514_08695 [Trichuris suis]|uniref:RNase H type-1 domain-containing protein n=1 Tax=Trichuris suis TaxID=68888 RepID=A0A085LZS2_9BILA|nr:hypothetical protein M513_08695 [Trichuris suis]KFD62355.1 hypothetical protein M514_08695 [Trichuris suis]